MFSILIFGRPVLWITGTRHPVSLADAELLLPFVRLPSL